MSEEDEDLEMLLEFERTATINRMSELLYDYIKYKCPLIANLKVQDGLITFDEGQYTKEEVEAVIAQLSVSHEKPKYSFGAKPAITFEIKHKPPQDFKNKPDSNGA